MLRKISDAALKPLAKKLHQDHMKTLVIASTMRLSRHYNRATLGRFDRFRRAQFRDNFTALLEENGVPTMPLIELKDGYAIDTSMSLPHLPALLEQSAQIIRERSGVRRSQSDAYRSYF